MPQHDRPYYGQTVSVIIPVNWPGFFKSCLPRWLEQTYERYQIIVVDMINRSADMHKMCLRYKQEIAYELGAHRCIYLNGNDDLISSTYVGLSQCQSILAAISSCQLLPFPYILDISMMMLEEGTFVSKTGFLLAPVDEIKQVGIQEMRCKLENKGLRNKEICGVSQEII